MFLYAIKIAFGKNNSLDTKICSLENSCRHNISCTNISKGGIPEI
jgi:hypothetical protein